MRPIKRRKFAKIASLSAASLLLPNILASQPKRKIGVALLGLGSYSTYNLAPALQRTQYCELRGIVTGTPAKILRWQKQYQIADQHVYAYENMDQLANDDQIDVVYVVTPTGTHADFVIRAANAGKHVWCEKPMAMTVSECQSMMEACKQNNVKLTIGYRVQHEPNTIAINAYASSLPFGPIQSLEAAAGYHGGGGTDWRFQRNMGGGALYDMGVYTINGMRSALKLEPLKVTKARQYTDRPNLFKEVDETTAYELVFPNNIRAKGMTSVGKGYNHLHINCEHGWYETRPMQTYSGVTGYRSDGRFINKHIANQQAKQMDDDALCLLENKEFMIPPSEGLKDIRIIEAIIESAKRETEVDL